MKILHTSDWHLGRSFHGVGMLDAQRRFVDQLVELVAQRGVDVVLISGDVYDRALPPIDVVELLSSALHRLVDAGAQVVYSAGNHDSAVRLGFADRILAHGGVHVRTDLDALSEPVIFDDDDDGDDDDGQVAVYAVPYLEPRLVAGRLGVEKASHQVVIDAAVGQVREDLQRRRAQSASPIASIIMAHVFASGAQPSDSERELTSGGLGQVAVSAFDGFDYAALGHLHGRQQLSETVRYSGSPLAYSFSEARHVKGGWLLEMDGKGLHAVEPVEFAAERDLRVLRGTLEGLLADPELDDAQDAWCQITLTDRDRPMMAMERLRKRFPSTLVLHFDPQGRPERSKDTYRARVAKAVDDVDICAGFLEQVRSRPASETERALVGDAFEAVRVQSGAR